MRKGGRSSISRWIILVAGFAFAGFVFYSLLTVEPVKVVRSHLEREGDSVFVSGEVRNTADHPRAIDLEVHYYDRNGRPIGQDSIVLDELGAGAVRDFKSPSRTISGVEDFSLYMNNGRNPYGN
jgi:hypothetical protein